MRAHLALAAVAGRFRRACSPGTRRSTPPLRMVVLAAALLTASGSAAALDAQDTAFTRARVLDVETGAVLENATVLVSDGRIRSVEAGGVVPPGYTTVDVQGLYLLPGLMDAHAHITNLEDARRALLSGVTTARSMGASHYVDVGIRELGRAGSVDAPELLAAGYHVRPPAGDDLFLDHPDLVRYRPGGIQGEEAIRETVTAILDRDVDWIKTNATERAGLPETDPRKQFYSEAEMRVMVEVAGARDVGVAAHAHGDAGGRAAVEAGVRSLEHGTFLTPATLARMAELGTFLVPTMAIVADLTTAGGDYDSAALQMRGRVMLPRMRETVREAHRLGVPIVASTDTGYGPNSVVRVSHELEEFVGIGMTPLEALQSATTVAGDLLDVTDRTGRVEPGMEADLIVLERNPLDDIRAVQDVLMVVNNGRIVVTRGDYWPGLTARPIP